MHAFMDRDFLLDTETSKWLYHDCAERLPIIDYHCHLSPREIAENQRYSNITEVWLYGDHYKWRAMRNCGVDEKHITGEGSDYEKFRAYCGVMPLLAGNPLYHWSHMELRQYFDCDLILCPENCDAIWKLTAARLAEPDMGARDLIARSGVRLLCTTDDPADSLEYHRQIRESGYGVSVLPAFRPDKGMQIERHGIADYMKRLGESTSVKIVDCETLFRAYTVALDRFAENGCRTADHGMDNGISYARPDSYHAENIFRKAMESDGAGITEEEAALWKTHLLRFFGKYYRAHGWVMQLHYGVLRNPNRRMFTRLGADSGFDMINGRACADQIAALLDYLETQDALPRTVLYPINPADNAAVGTLCGSFCRGDGSGMPTVVQGSAWWFNDNIDGMRAQLASYANLAALGEFPGMLTDSRSFLSYPRHAYFRRIFCGFLGRLVEEGQYPDHHATLERLVRRVCFENTNRLFGFGLESTGK